MAPFMMAETRKSVNLSNSQLNGRPICPNLPSIRVLLLSSFDVDILLLFLSLSLFLTSHSLSTFLSPVTLPSLFIPFLFHQFSLSFSFSLSSSFVSSAQFAAFSFTSFYPLVTFLLVCALAASFADSYASLIPGETREKDDDGKAAPPASYRREK